MSLTKGIQNQQHHLHTIEKFFKDFEYETPEYQRSYKWRQEHIDDFFTSISELLESNVKLLENDNRDLYQLYFGSVMLTKDQGAENRFKIIDGQQRCISFLLLLSAIKERIAEELGKSTTIGRTNEEDVNEAQATFDSIRKLLFKKKRLTDRTSSDQLKISLHDKKDMDLLKKIVAKADISAIGTKNNRVQKNFELIQLGICELLQKQYYPTGTTNLDKLNFIYDQIVNNIYMLVMTLNNDYEAFAIFESLNSRGLDLTPFDLINGYIVTKIKDASLKDKWEKKISDYKGDDVPLDNYIFYWWQSKGNDTPQIDLYDKIKKHINNDSIDKHVTEILNAFEMLYDFLSKPAFLSQYFLLLKRKKIIPLFLALKQKKYTDDETNCILVKVIKYSVVEMNLRGQSPGTFQYKIRQILETILKSSKRLSFEDVVGNIPDIKQDIASYDRKIFTSLIDGSISDDQFIKCLFYMIVEKENSGLLIPDFANIDIEHLFPQRPAAKWYTHKEWAPYADNEEEKAKLINMLGNMVLLSKKLNRSIKNQYILDKKSEIDKVLCLTDYFKSQEWSKINYSKFSPEYIKLRTESVINTIINCKVFDFINFSE